MILCLFFLSASNNLNSLAKQEKLLVPQKIQKIITTYQIEPNFYDEISKYKTFNENLFLDYYLTSKEIPKPLNYIFLLNKVNYPNFLLLNEESHPKLTNPVLLVNPKFKLDENFVPHNLVKITKFSHIIRDYEMLFSDSVIKDYQALCDFLTINNSPITIFSAYRSYDYQKTLYKPNNPFTAKPGESEHQTGLALDLSTLDYGLSVNFENSKAFELLKNNAHLFGFILRYPKDKENLTGYPFEPWHYRYVGVGIARIIKNENLCLEEYFYKYVLLDY